MSGRAGRGLVRSVGLAVLLAIGATACSGSDGAAATATSRVGPVAADRWSRSFCSAYATWTGELDEAGATAAEAFALPDRAANKAALVVLFDASAAATHRLATAIEAAGVPDVDGGPALVADLVARLDGHQDALAAIGRSAEGLTTDPEAEFLRQVGELRTGYQAARAEVGTAFAALGGTEAGEALAASLGDGCGAAAP